MLLMLDPWVEEVNVVNVSYARVWAQGRGEGDGCAQR